MLAERRSAEDVGRRFPNRDQFGGPSPAAVDEETVEQRVEWAAIASMYVTNRNADCDSPSAMRCAGVRVPEGLHGAGVSLTTSARHRVKMSYE